MSIYSLLKSKITNSVCNLSKTVDSIAYGFFDFYNIFMAFLQANLRIMRRVVTAVSQGNYGKLAGRQDLQRIPPLQMADSDNHSY